MKTYPIFAVIEDKPCLVVGGGAVGERKVADLMAAGARVTVVSRTLTPELASLADRGEIRYLPEDFTEAQVEGMALVMAATDDPDVNARVSELTVDDEAFVGSAATQLANPNASARKATDYGVSLNWYLNRNIKVQFTYDQTTFEGGAAGGLDQNDEKIFFTRLQAHY